MRKIIAYVIFILNLVVVYGGIETKLFTEITESSNDSIGILMGILAISVFGLFSIEMYRRKIKKQN